ncbi:MAG: acyltransferase [Planctomycetaceae bacterium]|nr:acyltransferase [Planctomycetaceae bacterium]
MRGRDRFTAAAPVLRALSWSLRLFPRGVCEFLLTLARHIPTVIGIGLRYVLVARLARHCGDCVAIHEGVYLRGLSGLSLGSHISIHPLCYLDACGGVTIGDEVSIAHATSILSTNHDHTQHELTIREAPVLVDPVVIGSDVWIGCGVRVLAGVTIGDRTVVGAGAVVTRSLPAGTVGVGVPARPLTSAARAA